MSGTSAPCSTGMPGTKVLEAMLAKRVAVPVLSRNDRMAGESSIPGGAAIGIVLASCFKTGHDTSDAAVLSAAGENVNPVGFLKLPLSFDSARMRAECDAIVAARWRDHFNTAAYDGGWSCIPLRSPDGRLDDIIPVEGAAYRDTVILDACPYMRQVLAAFRCETTSVRLMALAPGAGIKEHRDAGAAFEHGVARLHVPLQTAPEVVFRVDGEAVHFSQGDAWYLNASRLHGVRNDSAGARIHLMLDCVVNPWLERLFARAGFVPAAPPKYGDPGINDGNVADVIAQLTGMGGETATRMAARLSLLAGGPAP